MKKLLLLIALALLVMPVAFADRNRITYNFFETSTGLPVNDVDVIAFKCTDAQVSGPNDCATVASGLNINENTGSAATLQTSLPSTSAKTDYAVYFTKSGFAPKEQVMFDLQANQRFAFNVNFNKIAQCKANIGVVFSPLIPIPHGSVFSVAVPVQSAFNADTNKPLFIPNQLKDEFYSSQVDVFLTLTNAANPAITATQVQHFNIFAGTSAQALFSELQNLQLPAGTYNAEVSTVVVDDQCGSNVVQNVQLRQIILNSPPVITVTPPGPFSIAEQQPVTFTVTASDPEGTQVTLTAASLPAGAAFNNGVFAWTPSFAQSGTYNIVFTATDIHGGIATKTVTINVGNVPSAPRITSTPNLFASVGVLYTYDVEAVDDEGKTITFSLAQAPTGMTINPASGLIQWVPTAPQIGSHTVEVRAADTTGGFNSQTYTVTVVGGPGNSAPIIAPIGNRQIAEGDLLQFTVTATDPDGDAVTLSAANVPQGATFVQNRFSWRPSSTQSGVYQVTFTATDARGASSSQTVTITVVESQASAKERVTLTRVNMPDIVYADTEVPMRIEIFNDASRSLDDVRVTVFQYDLDVRHSLGPFDVSAGDSEAKTLFISIPEDAPQGTYDIEIRVSNDNKHRVIYRSVTVY